LLAESDQLRAEGRFRYDNRPLAEVAAGDGASFPLVIGLGVLPADYDEAGAVVRQLAGLTTVSKQIELFDRAEAPLPAATAERLEKQTPHLCLGVRLHETLAARDAANLGYSRHLGLVRLSEPLYESPDEE